MRSEAQREADKRYRAKNKNKLIHWATALRPQEARELDALILEKNMNRAQFLRWAMNELKEKENGRI